MEEGEEGLNGSKRLIGGGLSLMIKIVFMTAFVS